jgi:biotin carboxylase
MTAQTPPRSAPHTAPDSTANATANAIADAADAAAPHGRLLLIGGVDAVLDRAVDLGLRVVLMQHPDKLTLRQARRAALTLVADYTDWAVAEPLARAVRAAEPFDTVLSLTEGGMETAARLNDLFGLGGASHEVSRRLRDKWLTRTRMAELGLPVPPFGQVTDRASLAAFGERAGYPFIVKPTGTTAGFGLLRVAGPEDLDRVWAEIYRLLGQRTDRGSTLFTVDVFLMEGYVPGPEFSVEALSFAGRHVAVGITEKLVSDDHFAELGHALPARLRPSEREAVTEAVGAFLDAMGITDGATHTELRLSPTGPVVIESHHRVGGGHIGELVQQVYGVDLLREAVGWATGLRPALPGPPEPRCAASTRFVVREPGTVTAVSGVTQAAARLDVLSAEVTASPGDTVRPLRDNWDRLGSVVVRAEDTATAVELARRLAEEEIHVEVAPALPETLPRETASVGAAAGAAVGAAAEAVGGGTPREVPA